jgi:hypothetical protein
VQEDAECQKNKQPRSGNADDPLVVDWQTLDQSVWNVVKALKLLPPEILSASLAIPYSQQHRAEAAHSIDCSQLCDPHRNIQKPQKKPVVFNVDPALFELLRDHSSAI